MTHKHWIVPLKRIMRMILMVPLAIAIQWYLGPYLTSVWFDVALYSAAMGHQLYYAWCIVVWRYHTLELEEDRIIESSGVLNKKQESIWFHRITDFWYQQTISGHLLNYGTLYIVNAGQTRLVNKIEYVPDVFEWYMDICHYQFAPRS